MMKKLMPLMFACLTLSPLAQAKSHQAEMLCFDNIYRNLGADFEIQYVIVPAKVGLELAIIKLSDQEGVPVEVLHQVPVKKSVLKDRTVYSDTKNTSRLEVMKKNYAATGFAKAADLEAKKMDCIPDEEVEF